MTEAAAGVVEATVPKEGAAVFSPLEGVQGRLIAVNQLGLGEKPLDKNQRMTPLPPNHIDQLTNHPKLPTAAFGEASLAERDNFYANNRTRLKRQWQEEESRRQQQAQTEGRTYTPRSYSDFAVWADNFVTNSSRGTRTDFMRQFTTHALNLARPLPANYQFNAEDANKLYSVFVQDNRGQTIDPVRFINTVMSIPGLNLQDQETLNNVLWTAKQLYGPEVTGQMIAQGIDVLHKLKTPTGKNQVKQLFTAPGAGQAARVDRLTQGPNSEEELLDNFNRLLLQRPARPQPVSNPPTTTTPPTTRPNRPSPGRPPSVDAIDVNQPILGQIENAIAAKGQFVGELDAQSIQSIVSAFLTPYLADHPPPKVNKATLRSVEPTLNKNNGSLTGSIHITAAGGVVDTDIRFAADFANNGADSVKVTDFALRSDNALVNGELEDTQRKIDAILADPNFDINKFILPHLNKQFAGKGINLTQVKVHIENGKLRIELTDQSILDKKTPPVASTTTPPTTAPANPAPVDALAADRANYQNMYDASLQKLFSLTLLEHMSNLGVQLTPEDRQKLDDYLARKKQRLPPPTTPINPTTVLPNNSAPVNPAPVGARLPQPINLQQSYNAGLSNRNLTPIALAELLNQGIQLTPKHQKKLDDYLEQQRGSVNPQTTTSATNTAATVNAPVQPSEGRMQRLKKRLIDAIPKTKEQKAAEIQKKAEDWLFWNLPQSLKTAGQTPALLLYQFEQGSNSYRNVRRAMQLSPDEFKSQFDSEPPESNNSDPETAVRQILADHFVKEIIFWIRRTEQARQEFQQAYPNVEPPTPQELYDEEYRPSPTRQQIIDSFGNIFKKIERDLIDSRATLTIPEDKELNQELQRQLRAAFLSERISPPVTTASPTAPDTHEADPVPGFDLEWQSNEALTFLASKLGIQDTDQFRSAWWQEFLDPLAGNDYSNPRLPFSLINEAFHNLLLHLDNLKQQDGYRAQPAKRSLTNPFARGNKETATYHKAEKFLTRYFQNSSVDETVKKEKIAVLTPMMAAYAGPDGIDGFILELKTSPDKLEIYTRAFALLSESLS
ncbi:hypothetical protein HY214_03160 [Candidatus Roizmanbacteria bacterium]|nr:hypothetical protein [Candidatus Roizmanbacteria bacterium]